MFDVKNILKVFRDKLYKKNVSIQNVNSDYNVRNDIIYVTFENDFIVIDIKDECSFMEYSNTIDKCYNKLNQAFIPIKILITNGGNIKDWVIYKQKIYILKNNNYDFMLSVSDSKVQLSQTVLKDELYYETEFHYNFANNKYIIYKLVHDLNRSTKCPKWFPEDENSPFYLDREEAIELFNNLFVNLKDINDIDIMIKDIDFIENNIIDDFNIKRKVL